MDTETYKLDELAAKAGVSTRTVRYYVQRGLLPAPAFKGKDSAYGREQLARLHAIKRLQERYWPLDGIQDELARRTLAEIEALATGPVPAPPGAAPPPPSPQIPAPPSRAPPASHAYERIELAPGLELHLAAEATAETRALFAALVAVARTKPGRR